MKRTIATLLATLLSFMAVTLPASAQDSYRIKSGDVIRVEVLEDASLNRDAVVLPDGRISFPLAGSIKVAGRSLDQVRGEMSSKLAPNFATEPTVFVSIKQLAASEVRSGTAIRTSTIYILGEVAKPGAHQIERGTTVLQALAQVGGFSKFAATKRIQLRRTDKSRKEHIYKVNYQAILQGKSSIGTTIMEPGDVIIVPQRRLFE